MEKFLEIKGLNNNNLDILIKKNTISTFSGANNCGKTTFIRILGKQLDCESEIELENKKIQRNMLDGRMVFGQFRKKVSNKRLNKFCGSLNNPCSFCYFHDSGPQC